MTDARETIIKALQPGGAFHGLTAYRQFLRYRLVEQVGGKVTKVPMNAGGSTGSFESWEEAVAGITDWQTQGVGFAFTADDPFFFLDIDHAKQGDGWSPLALELFKMLKGVGFEVSTSNTGMHLIGTAAPVEHRCKREDLGIEFYTEKRFVALTGRLARGDCSLDLSRPVAEVVAKYFTRPVGVKRAEDIDWVDEADSNWRGPEDDDALIERMRGVKARVDAAVAFSGGPIRTRATFSDLFDANLDVLVECFPTQEDGKEYGFSEADSALADKLAYWTGRNPVRMERIMRRSALLREKWDDSDGRYLKLTIRKSCAKCTRVEGETPDAEEVAERWSATPNPDYRGSTDTSEIAAKMLSEDAKSGKLTAARSTGDLRRVVSMALHNTGLSGDLALGVCKLLVPEADEQDVRAVIVATQAYKTSFRGMPSQWDRAPDIDGVEVLPFSELQVPRVVRNINDHFSDAHSLLNEAFCGRLASFDSAPHWWEGRRWEPVSDAILRRHVGVGLDMGGEVKLSNSRIAGTAAVLKDQLPLRRSLNPASVLVFFRNCVVNAVDGKVSHHSPGNGNSYLLNCDYAPDAECPTWLAWLADIFETDLQRIELLQEMFGWALVTDNLDIHKAVTWVGVQRAGKGTALKLLAKMLGDAAGAFQLADLVDDKVLAGMLCRNIVIDYDAASADRSIARQLTGRFKAITANEPMSVRLLYTQTPFQGRLNCKLFMAANSVPTLWDDSGASANRWVPLVFDKSFLGKEDSQLFASLDAEIEGVAMWALEGLRRLVVNRRFTMPVSSQDELASLVDKASPLGRFIEEVCVAGPDYRVKEKDLWESYVRWAVGQGFEPGKRPSFMDSFLQAARGLGAVKKPAVLIDGHRHRAFCNIGLRDDPPPKSNVLPIR